MVWFDYKEFIAGWIGGVFSVIVGHPCDTVKVRQQTFGAKFLPSVIQTYRYEGFTGFYKGIIFPLLCTGPNNSLFFGVFSSCMHLLGSAPHSHKIQPVWNWQTIGNITFAGCLGGFAQVLVTVPMELVKVRQQTEVAVPTWWWGMRYESHKRTKPLKHSLEIINYIVQKEGIRGLYTGFIPTVIRDVPTASLYILVYEVVRYSSMKQWRISHIVKEILAGGTAGLASVIVTVPFDVVKTRMQADSLRKRHYHGMLDCFAKSYKEGGLAIFFKGTIAISLRAFPMHATLFVVYETVMTFLEDDY